MVQTYQGYFQDNGQFMAYEKNSAIRIPSNVEVYVVVTGKKLSSLNKTKSQKQGEALDKLLATLGTIENEPFDDEFDQIVNSRVNISRELDL